MESCQWEVVTAALLSNPASKTKRWNCEAEVYRVLGVLISRATEIQQIKILHCAVTTRDPSAKEMAGIVPKLIHS